MNKHNERAFGDDEIDSRLWVSYVCCIIYIYYQNNKAEKHEIKPEIIRFT